jgi:hypothetical protein
MKVDAARAVLRHSEPPLDVVSVMSQSQDVQSDGMSESGPRLSIRKVDVDKRRERFEWWAGACQERQLITQQRGALSKISPMSAPGVRRAKVALSSG